VFFKVKDDSYAEITGSQAFRHLIVFQIKLAADAVRDLLLSPISIVVFFVDAVRKPTLEESWYLRLMILGRQSDRVINLFDEHKDAGHYTVDESIEELERLLRGAKKPDVDSTSD